MSEPFNWEQAFRVKQDDWIDACREVDHLEAQLAALTAANAALVEEREKTIHSLNFCIEQACNENTIWNELVRLREALTPATEPKGDA